MDGEKDSQTEGDYSEQNAAVGTKRKFLSNSTHINEVKKYLSVYYEKKYSKISLIGRRGR